MLTCARGVWWTGARIQQASMLPSAIGFMQPGDALAAQKLVVQRPLLMGCCTNEGLGMLASLTTLSHHTLATENLLEDTDRLPRPP